MATKTKAEPKAKCHDCNVKPGQIHKSGCDTEQCPYCGGQLISCGCLRDKKRAAWIEKNLLPWTGVWPGEEEAIEFGLWCKWVPNEHFEADKKRVGLRKALSNLGPTPPGRWAVCGKDDPGAMPSRNRLLEMSVWDRDKKRFVKA